MNRIFRTNVFKILPMSLNMANNKQLHTSPSFNSLLKGLGGSFSGSDNQGGIGAQSNRMSDGQDIFEVQIHLVRPHFMPNYLGETKRFVELFNDKNSGAELFGSFTCEIGQQDEAIHIWRFRGGYQAYQKHYHLYRSDAELLSYRQKRNEMLRSRRNQLCLRFTFWPELAPRTGEHIYEMRSYNLRPGNLLEWGNYWANGMRIRGEENEAVCGLFSHIGEQHQVHHLWCYNDLAHRDEVRDLAWHHPAWADTVRKTVALVDTMSCRVLKATPFSPLQ
ncbi:hypothetical protein BOX15_Mlig030984g2 [Macrostomum lignano]|uniref:Uncharacterized protein n=2 Tax=Macrostomum lignano TaxID=282301 RepID=A0A267GZ58_9PLAT|nr:hypothetical protein BOX15_Mlig030984g2 [Macrostomum lignano]